MKKIIITCLLLAGIQSLFAACLPSWCCSQPRFEEEGLKLALRIKGANICQGGADKEGQMEIFRDFPEGYARVIDTAFSPEDSEELKFAILKECYDEVGGLKKHLIHQVAEYGYFKTARMLLERYPILNQVPPLYKNFAANGDFVLQIVESQVRANQYVTYNDFVLLLKIFLKLTPEHDPNNIRRFLTADTSGHYRMSPLKRLIQMGAPHLLADLLCGLFTRFPKLREELIPLVAVKVDQVLQQSRNRDFYPAWMLDEINQIFPEGLDAGHQFRNAVMEVCSASGAGYTDAIMDFIAYSSDTPEFDQQRQLMGLLGRVWGCDVHSKTFKSKLVSYCSPSGERLIHLLVRHGWIHCIESLTTVSEDWLTLLTNSGQTVFHMAALAPWTFDAENKRVEGKRVQVKKQIHILLELAAMPCTTADGGLDDQSIFPLKLINNQDVAGKTALHVALEHRVSSALVERLIALGARMDIPDKSGVTAMQLLEERRWYQEGRPTPDFIATTTPPQQSMAEELLRVASPATAAATPAVGGASPAKIPVKKSLSWAADIEEKPTQPKKKNIARVSPMELAVADVTK